MIRQLHPYEYGRIGPMIAEMGEGGTLPDPHDSTIIVDEDEHGEIVAFTCVRYIIHIEPTWIRKDHRGLIGGSLLSLFNYVRKHFRHINYFVMHTSQPRVGELMSRFGLVHLADQQTYEWRRPS